MADLARTRAGRPPWRDRTGALSWLRLAALVLVILPVFYVGMQAWQSAKYTRTLDSFTSATILFYAGTSAIWLLLAALSVTPLRRMLGWNRLIGIRRMLGLAAFAYTLLHIVFYLVLRSGSLSYVLNELMTRLTIVVALLASLCLALLAATSTDKAIRRLGPWWNRIHKLAYAATGLAILHYIMAPLTVGGEAYLMAGLYFWLMGWRLLNRRRLGADPRAIALLTLVTALLTAGFEAGMMLLLKGVSLAETLALNLTFEFGTPPSFGVLFTGMAALALMLAWRALRNGRAASA